MSAVFYISYLALWVLVIVQAIMLLLVYRHFGLIALGTAEGVQRDGLAIGLTPPTFKGMNSDGVVTEWQPEPTHRYFMAFVSPDCGPCTRIMPALFQLAKVSSNVEVVLIIPGPVNVLTRLISTHHPPSEIVCLSDGGNLVTELYRVRVTPFAFMIGGDARVRAKGLCDSTFKLQQLLSAGGVEVPDSIASAVVNVVR